MPDSIQQIARRTIELEARSIAGLSSFINEDFEKAAKSILACPGRFIISGMGKSAVIAQKIVATLNSTGTPSVFMHAGDAIHGDLGIVQKNDIVMVISKSGESPEIKALVPLIKNFGNLLIGMVGQIDSFLARKSDIVLNTTVEQEACPNNLAPTSSTTAQMVMGDALAIVLMELRGFQSGDFAKYHPGGTLGKKLYLHVRDLYPDSPKPAVLSGQFLKEVIVEMTNKRLGITAVIDQENNLLGIITDGDLRRMLEKNTAIDKIKADDIMTAKPITIRPGDLAIDALNLLRNLGLSQLVVVEGGKYLGIVHLHDLVREGLL